MAYGLGDVTSVQITTHKSLPSHKVTEPLTLSACGTSTPLILSATMVASTLPKLIGFDSDVWEEQISSACLQESCLREGLLELIVD